MFLDEAVLAVYKGEEGYGAVVGGIRGRYRADTQVVVTQVVEQPENSVVCKISDWKIKVLNLNVDKEGQP